MKVLYLLSIVAMVTVVLAAARADDILGAIVLFALGLAASFGIEFGLMMLAVRVIHVSPMLVQNLLAVSGVVTIPLLTLLILGLISS